VAAQEGILPLSKAKRRTAPPKKIKVTKREAAKKPWYERPVLLFGVIAALLIIGGVLMAHLYRRSSGPPVVLGTADSDSAAVVAVAAEELPAGAPVSHVLTLGTPLPEAQPGHLLPPLRVETLADGPAARSTYRAARDLSPPGAAGPVFGFVDAREAAAALSGESGATRAGLVEHLKPAGADRNWLEFEVQQDVANEIYLLGYVAPDVAEQFGVLGDGLSLPPAVAEKRPPKWQFWRKRDAGPVVVRAGATITLYPDPSPEATCALVLPFDHIATATAREIVGGVARRTIVMDVTLQ
jgi:hypothetical protein